MMSRNASNQDTMERKTCSKLVIRKCEWITSWGAISTYFLIILPGYGDNKDWAAIWAPIWVLNITNADDIAEACGYHDFVSSTALCASTNLSAKNWIEFTFGPLNDKNPCRWVGAEGRVSLWSSGKQYVTELLDGYVWELSFLLFWWDIRDSSDVNCELSIPIASSSSYLSFTSGFDLDFMDARWGNSCCGWDRDETVGFPFLLKDLEQVIR